MPPWAPGPPGGDRHPPAHLHWPLSLSQVGSASSCTPGLEQLHSSQPTSGWQPKVRGWQVTQPGGTVRGGQRQWPVSSLHRRPSQSQAAGSVHSWWLLCPLQRPQTAALGLRPGQPSPPPGPAPPRSGPWPQAAALMWGQPPGIAILEPSGQPCKAWTRCCLRSHKTGGGWAGLQALECSPDQCPHILVGSPSEFRHHPFSGEPVD